VNYGCNIPLTFHEMGGTTSTNLEISNADFETLLQYVDNKAGDLKCWTASDWYQNLSVQ